MKKFLTISIDVEPDCSRDWTYSNPLTFRGVHEGIGKILHPLFQRHKIKPTYLMNNVVMEDPDSVTLMKSLKGELEIGTHLHPEFIEPQKQFFDYAGKTARRNCCFYSPEIETAKLANISRLFESRFGYSPTSFRAGRFSAGPNTVKSLLDLGYKVDTSVTPHINWCDPTREYPVDFTGALEQPYFIEGGTILCESDKKQGLLQVPVTIGMLRKSRLQHLATSGIGVFRKAQRNKRCWLRPAYSRFADMKELVTQYSHNYGDREVIVFNMMFHNIEVIPGLSPYTLTKRDCDKYINTLELFFDYCNVQNIRSVGLTDIHSILTEKAVVKMETVNTVERVTM
ncbi:polysaccharide deacetylase family protein [Flavitalea antarctica]